MNATNNSTGPRTAEGKQTSSRNATTHGAYSDAVLLPTEGAAAHRQLYNDLVDRYKPETATELSLLATIHSSEWRIRRALRIERNTLTLTTAEQHTILAEEFIQQGHNLAYEVVSDLAEAKAYMVHRRLLGQIRRDEAFYRKLLAQATQELTAEIQARLAKAAAQEAEPEQMKAPAAPAPQEGV